MHESKYYIFCFIFKPLIQETKTTNPSLIPFRATSDSPHPLDRGYITSLGLFFIFVPPGNNLHFDYFC